MLHENKSTLPGEGLFLHKVLKVLNICSGCWRSSQGKEKPAWCQVELAIISPWLPERLSFYVLQPTLVRCSGELHTGGVWHWRGWGIGGECMCARFKLRITQTCVVTCHGRALGE